jgi:hypothetical protein
MNVKSLSNPYSFSSKLKHSIMHVDANVRAFLFAKSANGEVKQPKNSIEIIITYKKVWKLARFDFLQHVEMSENCIEE